MRAPLATVFPIDSNSPCVVHNGLSPRLRHVLWLRYWLWAKGLWHLAIPPVVARAHTGSCGSHARAARMPTVRVSARVGRSTSQLVRTFVWWPKPLWVEETQASVRGSGDWLAAEGGDRAGPAPRPAMDPPEHGSPAGLQAIRFQMEAMAEHIALLQAAGAQMLRERDMAAEAQAQLAAELEAVRAEGQAQVQVQELWAQGSKVELERDWAGHAAAAGQAAAGAAAETEQSRCRGRRPRVTGQPAL